VTISVPQEASHVTSQSEWPLVESPRPTRQSPLFFTTAEWNIAEAATSRIIPTDHDPGAREAQVVRFLDQFLAGIDYLYAAADGAGFLRPTGRAADAWETRIAARRQMYRDGLRQIEALARDRKGVGFVDLGPSDQDEILEALSGQPKPDRFQPVRRDNSRVQHRDAEAGAPPPTNQPITDEGLSFFDMLVLHTRQGFYADPVYGGNAGHVGWAVIGFPGPASLAETTDGRYSTAPHMS
jgi:gluconate 2-dehydrogenase gamma chain